MPETLFHFLMNFLIVTPFERERKQRLGKHMQEPINMNQLSILIVWQNGGLWIQKHETHHH